VRNLVLFALLLTGISTVGATSAAAGHGAPFGAAGCGLGAVVFGGKPGIVQIFAATTNVVLLDNQTFGITSGTLHCGARSYATVAAHEFIETNREAFAKDVSRGSGETIDTIAAIGGCRDPRAVAATLQRNFKRIFPSARTANTEVSAQAMDSLKSDKQLACTELI